MQKKLVAPFVGLLLVAMCFCFGLALFLPEYPNVYPAELPFLRVGDQVSCRGGTHWTTTQLSTALVRTYAISDSATAQAMDKWLREQWRKAATTRDNRAALPRFPVFYWDLGLIGFGVDKEAF